MSTSSSNLQMDVHWAYYLQRLAHALRRYAVCAFVVPWVWCCGSAPSLRRVFAKVFAKRYSNACRRAPWFEEVGCESMREEKLNMLTGGPRGFCFVETRAGRIRHVPLWWSTLGTRSSGRILQGDLTYISCDIYRAPYCLEIIVVQKVNISHHRPSQADRGNTPHWESSLRCLHTGES